MKFKTLLALAALAGTMIVSGCSSSDTPDLSSGNQPPAPADAPKGPEAKTGVGGMKAPPAIEDGS